jgi:c-di-GMP-binding flagellar brake protein YcgR
MQMRKDRRIKQWNKTLIKVQGGAAEPSGLSEVAAYTSDISLGGARIHSPEPFEVGALLQLRIELVRSVETIAIEARVKWSGARSEDGIHELGVEFQHTSSNAFMSLMRNIHEVGPRVKAESPVIDSAKAIR